MSLGEDDEQSRDGLSGGSSRQSSEGGERQADECLAPAAAKPRRSSGSGHGVAGPQPRSRRARAKLVECLTVNKLHIVAQPSDSQPANHSPAPDAATCLHVRLVGGDADLQVGHLFLYILPLDWVPCGLACGLGSRLATEPAWQLTGVGRDLPVPTNCLLMWGLTTKPSSVAIGGPQIFTLEEEEARTQHSQPPLAGQQLFMHALSELEPVAGLPALQQPTASEERTTADIPCEPSSDVAQTVGEAAAPSAAITQQEEQASSFFWPTAAPPPLDFLSPCSMSAADSCKSAAPMEVRSHSTRPSCATCLCLNACSVPLLALLPPCQHTEHRD